MAKSVSFAVPPDTVHEENTERTPREQPESPDLYNDIICPPVRNQDAKPPIRFQVYGYAMTMFEIRDWAIARKFREDIPPFIRINPAIKEIRRRLPYKYKPGFDFVQVMDYDKDEEVGPVPCLCFFFASNASDFAIQHAKRKDLTKKYQDILGVKGMPKWYTPFRCPRLYCLSLLRFGTRRTADWQRNATFELFSAQEHTLVDASRGCTKTWSPASAYQV